VSYLKIGSTADYWIDMRDISKFARTTKSIKDALGDMECSTDPLERAVNADYYAIAKAVICRDGASNVYREIKRTFPLHQAYKIIGKV
jgi:hypothetical protein